MKRGFTLIEVLIVVILIGILVTLLIPQVAGMQERARVAEAKQVLGGMRGALMVYYMDHDTFPVNAAADIDAIENVLGEMIDEDSSLFAYSWDAGSNQEITVYGNRSSGPNTSGLPIAGSKNSVVEMVINYAGSATVDVTWE